MNYYPIGLNIEGKNCLIVGGGSVGTRKAERLLQYKARVTIISSSFSETLIKLNDNPSLTLLKKSYSSQDLKDIFLVIAATDNQALNRRISDDAAGNSILCNIADIPAASDFILPSIVKRGDLTITISTAGKSPAFAKQLRKDLAKQFGDEYAVFLELMGIIRKKLLSEKHDPESHRKLFRSLIENDLLGLIEQNNIKGIDDLFQRTPGCNFNYNELINQQG